MQNQNIKVFHYLDHASIFKFTKDKPYNDRMNNSSGGFYDFTL